MTGIAMSTAEKRSEIVRLLEIHTSWSDRRIAGELGVDHKTVGKCRKALEEPNEKEEDQAKKETKDEIIRRLEKTIKELTKTLKENESKLLDSEEKNKALIQEQAMLIRISNQK